MIGGLRKTPIQSGPMQKALPKNKFDIRLKTVTLDVLSFWIIVLVIARKIWLGLVKEKPDVKH